MRLGFESAPHFQSPLTRRRRWVLDPALTALMNISDLGMYTYTKSSTGRRGPVNESFTIEYGGGLVRGSMITETVAIAGLTFHNVSMGVANYTSPYFQQQPSIGLLGLGPQPTYGMMPPMAWYIELCTNLRALITRLSTPSSFLTSLISHLTDAKLRFGL